MKSNVNDFENENSIKIETIDESSSVTQVTENKCIRDFTSIKPNEEVLPVNVTEETKTQLKNTSLVIKKQKLRSSKKSQNNCLTCITNVISIVPVCYWYQNKSYIYLKFSILEVDDFNIECTMNSITLK